MHAGSNPAARTSQSQSSRSPYRGAGRLFSYSVRWLDGFPPTPNHEMRFSPFRAFQPIQSRYTQLSISPPSVPFFTRRRIGEPYSIRRAAPLFGLAGRDAPVFLPAFPSRLAARLGFRSPPRFPIRPIGFSPSSSPSFPPDGSVFTLFCADERR